MTPHNAPEPVDRTEEPGRRVYATFVRSLVEVSGGKDPLDWQLDVLWNTMSPAERADWNTKAEAIRPNTEARHTVTIVGPAVREDDEPLPEVVDYPEVEPAVLRWRPGSRPQLILIDEARQFADGLDPDEHNTEEH